MHCPRGGKQSRLPLSWTHPPVTKTSLLGRSLVGDSGSDVNGRNFAQGGGSDTVYIINSHKT
ncbi:hypothetical protein GCM10008922_35150 [Faecalicatena contorta]